MPTVYIVDDEAHIRLLVAEALRDHGMESATFADGPSLMDAIARQLPDCVILDWMMPPPDGLELCRQLRAEPRTATLPIIMLTARTEEVDRVLGLEIGADDYIPKPFGVRELAARVRALLRRRDYAEQIQEREQLELGPITMDLARRRVTRDGEVINLTQREFDLLSVLLQSPGQVFSRDMLLDKVWKTNYYGDTRTVDVHIRYLRQKIEADPANPRLILTIRGIGYASAAPDEL